LMGGRNRVLEEARNALAKEDAQWAAELATYLIRISHEDRDARAVKAAAFRKLGFAQKNTNWRNWYLASAHELDGTLDTAAVTFRARANFGAPETIAALPARVWVEGLTTRLASEKTLDVDTTMGFRFRETNETYTLEVRRGIAQFGGSIPTLAIELDKKTLDQVVLGRVTMAQGIDSGAIKVTAGTAANVLAFFNYFETPFADPIALTVR
jgi:alkyl sulfatase BDS1-like metallo-beta-lactamase superfamily hydrolase